MRKTIEQIFNTWQYTAKSVNEKSFFNTSYSLNAKKLFANKVQNILSMLFHEGPCF